MLEDTSKTEGKKVDFGFPLPCLVPPHTYTQSKMPVITRSMAAKNKLYEPIFDELLDEIDETIMKLHDHDDILELEDLPTTFEDLDFENEDKEDLIYKLSALLLRARNIIYIKGYTPGVYGKYCIDEWSKYRSRLFDAYQEWKYNS
jgi:hypothetical protein